MQKPLENRTQILAAISNKEITPEIGKVLLAENRGTPANLSRNDILSLSQQGVITTRETVTLLAEQRKPIEAVVNTSKSALGFFKQIGGDLATTFVPGVWVKDWDKLSGKDKLINAGFDALILVPFAGVAVRGAAKGGTGVIRQAVRIAVQTRGQEIQQKVALKFGQKAVVKNPLIPIKNKALRTILSERGGVIFSGNKARQGQLATGIAGLTTTMAQRLTSGIIRRDVKDIKSSGRFLQMIGKELKIRALSERGAVTIETANVLARLKPATSRAVTSAVADNDKFVQLGFKELLKPNTNDLVANRRVDGLIEKINFDKRKSQFIKLGNVNPQNAKNVAETDRILAGVLFDPKVRAATGAKQLPLFDLAKKGKATIRDGKVILFPKPDQGVVTQPTTGLQIRTQTAPTPKGQSKLLEKPIETPFPVPDPTPEPKPEPSKVPTKVPVKIPVKTPDKIPTKTKGKPVGGLLPGGGVVPIAQLSTRTADGFATVVGFKSGFFYTVQPLDGRPAKFFRQRPEGIKKGKTIKDTFSVLETSPTPPSNKTLKRGLFSLMITPTNVSISRI